MMWLVVCGSVAAVALCVCMVSLIVIRARLSEIENLVCCVIGMLHNKQAKENQ